METIRNYFNAEKYESVLFVLVGITALVIAVYFLLTNKPAFYKGMAIPLISVALIQVVVGSTVWQRSPKDISRVENMITNEKPKIEAEEIPRMTVVLKNFVIYRYLEITLLIAGLVCMFVFNANPFVKGIGIGLFVQSALMLSLDFFAEERALDYMQFLQGF